MEVSCQLKIRKKALASSLARSATSFKTEVGRIREIISE